MAFNNPFLSDKARAWLGSIQGVPENQIPAKANLAAQSGLISFPEALAIKMIADRIRTPQGSIPQGTVMGEMLGGIASMDAGRMENPSFAGGGIVAFSNGGTPYDTATDQLNTLIREAEQKGDMRTATILRGQLRRMLAAQSGREDYVPEGGEGASQFAEFLRGDVEKSRPYLGAAEPVSLVSEDVPPPSTVQIPGAPNSVSKGPRRRYKPSEKFTPFEGGEKTSGSGIPRMNATAKGVKLLEEQIKELKNAKPEDREARYRAAGIEDMTPAQLKKLEDRIEKLSGEKKKDAYLALAQAGFKMAAAASRPGGTLLGSLGEGGAEGARLMANINKEYRDVEDALNDKIYGLQRYQQERREGRVDKDIDWERQQKKEIANLEKDKANMEIEAERYGIDVGIRQRALDASLQKDPITELKHRYIYARTREEREAALKMLSELLELDTRVIVQNLKNEMAAAKNDPYNLLNNSSSFAGQDAADIISQADKLVGQ